MNKKRIKVLMLGSHDSKANGHIQSDYLKMPPNVEAHMVTFESMYGNPNYCFRRSKNTRPSFSLFVNKIRYSKRLLKWKYQLYCFFHFGCIAKKNPEESEHCFFGREFGAFTAKSILKKCPKGFTPDIISIHWSPGFVSSKTIKDLHRLTGAKIVFCFVDEAHMTGGCHYPIECTNYLKNCQDCPALRKGKIIAYKQFEAKTSNLRNLPIYISGTPNDMRIAQKVSFFKNAVAIPNVEYPKVSLTSKEVARKDFHISKNDFVVLVGSTNIKSSRKGFQFASQALNEVKNQIPELTILFAGKSDDSIKKHFPNIKIINIGFVNLDTLYKAFCASDCFLNSTIADSGPMMVNYSFAIGTPVVSFPVGIAMDLIEHKKTGYIADYKNSTNLANGIIYLHSLSQEDRIQMSKECIKKIKHESQYGGWVKFFCS